MRVQEKNLVLRSTKIQVEDPIVLTDKIEQRSLPLKTTKIFEFALLIPTPFLFLAQEQFQEFGEDTANQLQQ